MKLYKMAQVDPTTNRILHISIWDEPSKAPDLVEVSELARIGITLEEVKHLEDEEQSRLKELEAMEEDPEEELIP